MDSTTRTVGGHAVDRARAYTSDAGVAVLPSGPASVRTPGGRTLTVSPVERAGDASELLVIQSEGGEVELAIELTARGPVLKIEAVGVQVSAAGRVDLACESFSVRAAERIELVSGGDAVVAGNRDATLLAGKTALVRGTDAEMDAVRGESRILANDDVRLRGERVLLNCED